ncbi:MAG TPA: hypothetical protein VK890_12565 [Bacteroidia bacterium]|jgi:hypothetical protein|nr:hypothetical protein [Bacteroidia bacterium]
MMRKLVYIAIALLVIACNRQPQTAETTKAPANDSIVRRVQQKDSSIMAYIKSINNIQGSIDTLMRQAHVLKMHHEGISDTGMISDLHAIGAQMLKNQRALVYLEMKLKQSNESNNELADLGENLSKQLNEKDSEITVMQGALAKTNASLTTLTKQFNDSINIINQERAQIGLMTTVSNTVYYIFGTEKELKAKGIIIEEGGAIGLGRVPVLKQDMSSSGFTTTDLTTLHEIPLTGSFVKMVTLHPEKAYKLAHSSPDKIIITDPQDFWSKSKYMVAIVQ